MQDCNSIRLIRLQGKDEYQRTLQKKRKFKRSINHLPSLSNIGEKTYTELLQPTLDTTNNISFLSSGQSVAANQYPNFKTKSSNYKTQQPQSIDQLKPIESNWQQKQKVSYKKQKLNLILSSGNIFTRQSLLSDQTTGGGVREEKNIDQILSLKQMEIEQKMKVTLGRRFQVKVRNPISGQQPDTSIKSSQFKKQIVKGRSDELYIVKAQIKDLGKIRMFAMQRQSDQQTSNNIYKQTEDILSEIQSGLGLSSEYKYLFLSNEKPFVFFQEVPDTCNLLFISKSQRCTFWRDLYFLHRVPFKFKTTSNFLLHKISEFHSKEEILEIFLKRNKFITEIEDQQADRLSVNPNLAKTRCLYRSNIEVDENMEELSQMKDLSPKEVPTQLENGDEEMEVFDLKRNNNIDSGELQGLLQQNRLTNPPQNTTILHLNDHRSYSKEVLKSLNYPRRNKYSNTQSLLHHLRNRYFNVDTTISKLYPMELGSNIPKQMKETNFNRNELHQVFSRYKSLLLLQSSELKGIDKTMMPHGLTFEVFTSGLDEMSLAPIGVVKRLFSIFSQSNTLDLEGFMKALNLIGAKSVDGKIDLILKVMDENGNGLLSYDEILERCNLMLDQILKKDNSELSIEKVSDYITRTVFDAVQVPYNEEIPLDKIKKLIECNSPEAQVLIMMCSGDVNYLK